MLYWITQQLPARIPGAHVFAYLTFRAILATASALGLSLLVGPSLIRHLVRGQIGQVVRDDGPPTHLLKAGTPTMGGTLILVTTLASTLLWAELSNRLVWTVLGVDRKSTRLNSSHSQISYAVFCLKKKKTKQ